LRAGYVSSDKNCRLEIAFILVDAPEHVSEYIASLLTYLDGMMKYRITQTGLLFVAFAVVFAPLAPGQNQQSDAPRIAWYATLESGMAEAKRSNRPILFTSAAPQCLGVSGIW